MHRRWTHACRKLKRPVHSHRFSSTDSRWPGWQVVIGIEVHAQIKSRAKLFSHAWPSSYDEEPNSHIDVFDVALPGTLPKLNSTCVELAARTALGLNAQIQRRSAFDRKHYFYADLPAGYQITQNYAPLAKGGRVELKKSGIFVNIKQLQLEQDTAKTTFDPVARNSAIDLNRAGTGLMEIVSEPDMRSPEQAGDYIRTLQALLRTVGSSDGNMEQGSLRCDVNVSVNRPGEPLGTRCEIKNLNSVKFMTIAVTSEVMRQIALLQNGDHVPQETRGYDEHKAETYKLRSKEDAQDYRYMPDPNIPPLLLDEAYIQRIRESMPELPDQTRSRLCQRGLSPLDADFLMAIDSGREVGYDGYLGKGAVGYFDSVSEGRDPKVTVNWITHDLYGQLIAKRGTFRDNPISVGQLGELIDMVQDGQITNTSGKNLLKHMIDTRSNSPPSMLAKKLSLMAFTVDDAGLDDMCLSAILALPDEADMVRQGNEKVMNKLVGYVMKTSRGRADARAVGERLKQMLSKS